MKDKEYIQPESETDGWVMYAEYLFWKMKQENEGMSQPKIEDRGCRGSQRGYDLTEFPF